MTLPPSSSTLILKGIPASPGIAVGKAFVISTESPAVTLERIELPEIPAEIARFRSAVDATTAELAHAAELARRESSTVGSIIDSYLLIANDPMMLKGVERRIERGTPAETAVQQEFDVHKSTLYQAKDAFLRERVQDFDHVMERVIAGLRNLTLSREEAVDSIVVSGSVTPQDMIFFKQLTTLGYVTEIGGINSHSCILAREFGVPAVIGIRNATERITDGSTIIIDGFSGEVVVDPDEVTIAAYRTKQRQAEAYRERLGDLLREPAVTRDGVHVTLMANIDAPDHVHAAVAAGCEGIGLVRTEMLLVRLGRYPTLEEETASYTEIADRIYPKTVTFRAFDVGSDKFRDGIPHHEENPALGLRGIRFLLYRPDIFEQQVTAILRASANRNVRFMLPMISTMEELDQAKAVIARCKAALTEEGVDFDPDLPIGVMIETPAAALLAPSFATQVDFFSIGTNDLAQYTLATDRTNELVADIFDAMHPAVLRLIRYAVDAARDAGISVSVCGELAGHAAATEILIGAGITELSVAPPLILELKHRIRGLDHVASVALVNDVTLLSSTTDVYSYMSAMQSARDGGDPL